MNYRMIANSLTERPNISLRQQTNERKGSQSRPRRKIPLMHPAGKIWPWSFACFREPSEAVDAWAVTHLLHQKTVLCHKNYWHGPFCRVDCAKRSCNPVYSVLDDQKQVGLDTHFISASQREAQFSSPYRLLMRLRLSSICTRHRSYLIGILVRRPPPSLAISTERVKGF